MLPPVSLSLLLEREQLESRKNESSVKSSMDHFLSLRSRNSLLAFLTLILFLLLIYNGAAIFCINLPSFSKISSENVSGFATKWSLSSSKMSSTVMLSVEKENPSPLLENPLSNFIKRSRRRKPLFQSKPQMKQFSTRVKDFFNNTSFKSPCKPRFFMTWISSLDSFGERELLSIGSVFKSHPTGCLIIVSNSMDSTAGLQILRPFLDMGFRVTAISPDFDYLFKNTEAETWFSNLKNGNIDPGEVSLGQNLSNLLRLSLLYKFGGIYIDSDLIVIKSFNKLRNCIGAQTTDPETGNWSRLNNAALVFDKMHPLLFKFIQEFALTFNGNKWGHNGPYLVSRVVSRVSGRPGFNFSILNPIAFYPVYWSRVDSLFHGPQNETHRKWLDSKFDQIQGQSYAVHLWNRQSKEIKIEEGSIIRRIAQEHCIFSINASEPVSIQSL
ncbi:lactosylceramide 4-alpha-galactosyltransferase-like [Impatiens glandulifera]|uniref:lactosylceramide 4-alpha-galactosyltransferase-like n=1 Tax=Impatiens glandulifera TaxID=253017 RepID=UPI001FB13F65|nr:lactosylceramide 4-alpha-galactosyltransferase-like [Impatiens glandulifera]